MCSRGSANNGNGGKYEGAWLQVLQLLRPVQEDANLANYKPIPIPLTFSCACSWASVSLILLVRVSA